MIEKKNTLFAVSAQELIKISPLLLVMRGLEDFPLLIQKQNAILIQHSITNARQKEIRNGVKVNHGYSNEFLDPDRIANVYFTSDVDAKNRMRSF